MGFVAGLLHIAVLYVCVLSGLARADAPAAKPADTQGLAVLLRAVARNDDPGFQADVLRALEGRRRVQSPVQWAALREGLLGNARDEVRDQAPALGIVFGDPAAFEATRGILADASLPAPKRSAALRSLLAAHDEGLAPTLRSRVMDPDFGVDVIAGLAEYDDPRTPGVLLDAYATLTPAARNVRLNVLAGRRETAGALGAAVDAGRVPRRDVTAATVRLLRDLGDGQVDVFVARHWGVARTTARDKDREIARFKQILTKPRIAAADTSRGRAVFARACAQCHALHGEGGTVGPDLTGADRGNLDYVLTNVVDPGAVISREYQVTLLRTKGGRVVSGIATETERAVQVVSDTGTVLIPRGEIAKVRLSDLSMMPEGLLSGLAEQEVADLVAYLRTTKQVPLTEGPSASSSSPK
jgi:putative heme-binding domain-containing protein